MMKLWFEEELLVPNGASARVACVQHWAEIEFIKQGSGGFPSHGRIEAESIRSLARHKPEVAMRGRGVVGWG